MKKRLPLAYCAFQVEGLNLERFLRYARQENIPLLSARRVSSRCMRCECYTADFPRLMEAAQTKGWKITEVRPMYFSATKAFLRKRWGVPLGILLAVAFVLIASRFVWRIEIQNAGAYRGDVTQYLQELHIERGAPKNRINAEALERALYNRYPQIARFSVYLQGVTLTIEIAQGTPQPDGSQAEIGDIYASRGGLIEEVRTYAGQAVVKVGDIVVKGQLLIHGEEQAADEQTQTVSADGVIIARCWTQCRATVSLRTQRSEQTGRHWESKCICTPWLYYPEAEETPPFLAYETDLVEYPVVGCWFPVWLQYRQYSELSLEYDTLPLAQAKQEAAVIAQRRLTDRLGERSISRSWTAFDQSDDGLLTATATAEYYENIASRERP